MPQNVQNLILFIFMQVRFLVLELIKFGQRFFGNFSSCSNVNLNLRNLFRVAKFKRAEFNSVYIYAGSFFGIRINKVWPKILWKFQQLL